MRSVWCVTILVSQKSTSHTFVRSASKRTRGARVLRSAPRVCVCARRRASRPPARPSVWLLRRNYCIRTDCRAAAGNSNAVSLPSRRRRRRRNTTQRWWQHVWDASTVTVLYTAANLALIRQLKRMRQSGARQQEFLGAAPLTWSRMSNHCEGVDPSWAELSVSLCLSSFLPVQLYSTHWPVYTQTHCRTCAIKAHTKNNSPSSPLKQLLLHWPSLCAFKLLIRVVGEYWWIELLT